MTTTGASLMVRRRGWIFDWKSGSRGLWCVEWRHEVACCFDLRANGAVEVAGSRRGHRRKDVSVDASYSWEMNIINRNAVSCLACWRSSPWPYALSNPASMLCCFCRKWKC